MYTTFLASAFRSIRFGLNEAHGKGIALQLNYLLDAGAFKVDPDGTFAVDAGQDQGRGGGPDARDHDPAGARATTRRPRTCWPSARVVRPEVQRVLDRLQGVPVDIEPRFVTADELSGRTVPAARQTPAASRKASTTRQ